ncbi:hypothetical protein ACFE04_025381 [Oxalis oulophora]
MASVTKTAPVKKTKAATTAAKKPAAKKPALAHPTFLDMITDAIVTMKERTGSSQYAINKFIEDKYSKQLPSNFKKLLLVRLKKLVADGKLVKVKNSFKVAKPTATAPAKKKPTEATKPKVVKPATAAAKPKKKEEKVKKVVAVKKPKVKSVKSPVKKAKTMRSPAKKAPVAKKAKK